MPRDSFLSHALLLSFLSSIALAQSSWLLQTFAGSDEVGDGGSARAALISQAEGLAVDPAGNVYVADAADHRVRRISAGGVITTVAGTGHPGFSGDGGQASAATLKAPYGIVLDRFGNLYVADLGNSRIRRVGANGSIVTLCGGGYIPAFQADGRPAVDVALNSPRNLAVDAAGNLYFSDFGAHAVYEITTAGTLVRIAGSGVAGFSGDGGSALSAKLNSPAGLAVDNYGTVYIADSGNQRIRKVWRGVISTLGDTGAGQRIAMFSPTAVILDTDGSLLIAEGAGTEILRVTPLLAITIIAQPARDLALDTAGNLYSCSGLYVYRRLRTGALSIFAGGGTLLGDSGPALKARLSFPAGIARDDYGNFYIADTAHHRIRQITADGVITTLVGTGLSSPRAVAVDRIGNVYIADTGNHRILRLDITGAITPIAGTGDPGLYGDGGSGLRARLDTPTGIALAPDGSLYIADTGNNLIRRVDAAGMITTVVGNANRAFRGDGGSPLAASLNAPTGVAVDSAGTLYIADTGNRRIRRVASESAFGPGIINTYPAGDPGSFPAPRSIAVDGSGVVYVSDVADQRVYTIDTLGRITAIAGDGWIGFNGESAPALTARLDTPSGIALDPAGNIYFADTGNHRIRKLSLQAETTTPPPVEVAPLLVNAASLIAGPVAPGELVTLFGSNLAAAKVLFDTHEAALLFVSDTQINLQVPYSIADAPTVDVRVLLNGVVKHRFTVGLAAAVPGIFLVSGSQAAALNEDGTLNSSANPAARGSVVTFYATGEGRVTPQPDDGVAAAWPYPAPILPVVMRIGDYDAEVLYAAAAPGFIGLMQINARVPAGFAPPGTLAVTLKVGSVTSQPGVTLEVR